MPADRDDDREDGEDDRPRRRDDDDDRPRRRRREEDDEDDYPTEQPVLPQGVKIAGLIWLVVGILILVVSMISFTLNLAMPQPAAAGGNAPAGANATSGVCGAIFGLLVGAVFVTAGTQTRSGKAKGTMGNGVGSLIFGLIAGGVGTLAVLGSFVIMQKNGGLGAITLVLSVVYVLAGIALLVAGVMGISGQEAYKKWRKWKVRQSR